MTKLEPDVDEGLRGAPAVTSDLITTTFLLRKQNRQTESEAPASPGEGVGQLRHTFIHLVMRVASRHVRAALNRRTKKRFEDQRESSEPPPHSQMKKMLLLLT